MFYILPINGQASRIIGTTKQLLLRFYNLHKKMFVINKFFV